MTDTHHWAEPGKAPRWVTRLWTPKDPSWWQVAPFAQDCWKGCCRQTDGTIACRSHLRVHPSDSWIVPNSTVQQSDTPPVILCDWCLQAGKQASSSPRIMGLLPAPRWTGGGCLPRSLAGGSVQAKNLLLVQITKRIQPKDKQSASSCFFVHQKLLHQAFCKNLT